MKNELKPDWVAFCTDLADLLHKHKINVVLIAGFDDQNFRNSVIGFAGSSPEQTEALNNLSDGINDYLQKKSAT